MNMATLICFASRAVIAREGTLLRLCRALFLFGLLCVVRTGQAEKSSCVQLVALWKASLRCHSNGLLQQSARKLRCVNQALGTYLTLLTNGFSDSWPYTEFRHCNELASPAKLSSLKIKCMGQVRGFCGRCCELKACSQRLHLCCQCEWSAANMHVSLHLLHDTFSFFITPSYFTKKNVYPIYSWKDELSSGIIKTCNTKWRIRTETDRSFLGCLCAPLLIAAAPPYTN